MASSINASTTAGLVNTADTSGVLQLQTAGTTAISIDASQAVSFTNSANLPNTFGFKNRIINGAMVIDQRNAGASVATTTTGSFTYTLDRWSYFVSQASKFTIQQNAGSVTPPVGFSNYLGITSTSAYSLTAGDYFTINTRIEGFNIADLGWGTANAKTITISFQVYSSLTGTFGGVLSNSTSRSYPFTYSIPVANTWTTISVTIAGDTSGTWLTNNGIGLTVILQVGTGTTFSGTAGAWAASNYFGATGATSVVGTNGATFYITGVQLEKGATATSFDYRPYGTEFALCQRYYYRIKADAGGQVLGSGMMNSATTGRFFIPFMVPMRTSPSALEQSGTASNYVVFNGGSAENCSAVPTFNSATLFGSGIQGTIASGGTIGFGALIRSDSSASFLAWSAEL